MSEAAITNEHFLTREYFVSRNGQAVRIQSEGANKPKNRAGRAHWFDVSYPSGSEERVCVLLISPATMNPILQQKGFPGVEEIEVRVVLTALLRRLDDIETLSVDEHGNRLLELSPVEVIGALTPSRLPDRELRRFIIRRVYDDFTRATLNDWFTLDEWDMWECGASLEDFLRNAQVLEAEEYFKIGEVAQNGLRVLPTAKMVRDVERYGAARDDAISEPDYLGTLEVYPAIASFLATIRLEYARYGHSTTPVELSSIFRALAPVVEAIGRELLRSRGSEQHHASLGLVIGDLRSRNIGGPPLWTQLNYVLKFGRDLEEHGVELPEVVLRIACANAFELIPQLAVLFPRRPVS